LSTGAETHAEGVQRILIVIPTYNEAESIDTMLDSVLTLADPDRAYEVLIVDDSSPDGTADSVRPWLLRSRPCDAC